MTKTSIVAYQALRRSFPSTSFTQLFNNEVKHPILQAPMMGSTSLSLISTVCNEGALGQLPAYKLSVDQLKQSVSQLRTMTNRPFGVNLGVQRKQSNSLSNSQFEANMSKVLSVLNELVERHNLPIKQSKLQSISQSINQSSTILPDFNEQLKLLFDLQVPIISFVFGIVDKAVISECRKRGILTIGTATSVSEVYEWCRLDVDAVVVQGAEAGGHRGGFLYKDAEIKEKRLTGLLPLLSSVRDLGVAGSTPLIAAGGIADAAGMVAAFVHGASAVQIGTAFLTCTESDSAVSEAYRDKLLAPHRLKQALAVGHNQADFTNIDTVLQPTVVTRGFTSRPARGFANDLTEAMLSAEADLLPWPQHNAVVSHVVAAATKQSKTDLMQMWAGQNYALCYRKSAAALVQELVQDAKQLMNL